MISARVATAPGSQYVNGTVSCRTVFVYTKPSIHDHLQTHGTPQFVHATVAGSEPCTIVAQTQVCTRVVGLVQTSGLTES